MPSVSLTGQDTIQINNRLLVDLADGNCVELVYPSEMANLKTGKNGNSIYALNESGKQVEVKVHIIRGAGDDRFLNNLLTQQDANFAGTVLLIGQFVKITGNGLGVISNDTYILSGGIFTKRVEAKSNTDGDVEQSVAIYTLKYAVGQRVIG